MGKSLVFILFCATMVLNISCKKDNCKCDTTDAIDKDYMVFGRFAGECMGEHCIEIFKIEDGNIFEDRNDFYPARNQPYRGNFEEIYPEDLKKVTDLTGKFPAELLNEKDTVIGTPDVVDQGGIYIEIKQNGQRRFWLIDQSGSRLPAYLRSFKDEVNAVIKTLQ